MTLTELKAHAYDTLAQIEFLQMRLRELNKQIEQEARKPREGMDALAKEQAIVPKEEHGL